MTTSTPALETLEKLQGSLKKRIGKPGGNLNERILSQFATIKTALLQNAHQEQMIDMIKQQGENASQALRALSRVQAMLTEGDSDGNGDDGTSETKGE